MSRIHNPAEIAAAPPWMATTLRVAAIYNLVWGAVAILAPQAMLNLLQVEPLPNHPEFWQCIGMIVGVYGVGYWIAASDPRRHWPIVLVGLLGKVLGPVGFLRSAWTGELPWSTGWTILTNDLIWWTPFALILWDAARANQPGAAPAHEDGDPWTELRSQNGNSLAELALKRPTLVVFLRHAGCTFCREAAADLQRVRQEIAAEGVQLALVHLGDESGAGPFFTRYGLQDVDRFSDPDRRLYRAFSLELGSAWQLLGPGVWLRGFVAGVLQGHGVGKLSGNGFQMPGAFLIKDRRVLRSFRHRTAADRPDYVELACPMAATVAA